MERTETARFVVLGPFNGGRGSQRSSPVYQLEKRALQGTYRATDERAALVLRQAGAIGAAYPAPVRAEAREELTAIRGLRSLRQAATATELNGLSVTGEYTSLINDILGFNKYLALPGNNAGLAQTVRAFGLVSQMKEEEPDQAAVLTSWLSPDLVGQGSAGPGWLAAMTSSMAAQNADVRAFQVVATAAQVQQYNSVLSGAPVERASTQETAVVATASGPGASAGPTTADASAGLTYQFSGLRALEARLSSSVISQTASRRGAAGTSIAVFSALLVVLILLLAPISCPPGAAVSQPGEQGRRGSTCPDLDMHF